MRKNGKKLVLGGGGERRMLTAWKSQHKEHVTDDAACLRVLDLLPVYSAYSWLTCSRSQSPKCIRLTDLVELNYSYSSLFPISECPKAVTKFFFFHQGRISRWVKRTSCEAMNSHFFLNCLAQPHLHKPIGTISGCASERTQEHMLLQLLQVRNLLSI